LLNNSKIPRPEQADNLPDLTPWAAGFRYSDLPEPALDRQETLSMVERTKAWATRHSMVPEQARQPLSES
jgi:hypothetical protein